MHNQSKQILRERILTLLRNQKEDERLVKSAVIGLKLFQLEEFRDAQTILFYASFDGEVETFEMMKEAQKLGKTIGLPGLQGTDKCIVPLAVASLESGLETGPYGIQQPKMDEAQKLGNDHHI
ncbi:MAG: 5-formyltetrahydrofolate cyclo-ligase [Planctomycetota bacterium]|nr:5-formyltetrahydrofolate cyclo-ligase [Planctomycetota bacterium]